MRRLLIRTSLLVAVFALLIGGARIVGSLNKAPAAALFESWYCSPQPCWHGLRPGATTFNQAQALLAADATIISALDHSSSTLCWQMKATAIQTVCAGPIKETLDSPIGYMFMVLNRDQDALRLGEAIRLFGPPRGAKLCWWRSGLDLSYPTPALVADVYFDNGVYVAAYSPQEPALWRLDPDMAVFAMSYAAGREYRGIPAWRGFITRDDEEGCGK